VKTLLHLPCVRPALPAALVALLSTSLLLVSGAPAHADATAPGLGTAGSFAVLAGAGVTNTGPTTLWGDLGTFPTTTVKGAGLTVLGKDYSQLPGGDAVTQKAKDDLVVAYDATARQSTTQTITAGSNLGGRRLTPGVYTSASTLGLTGDLVLDAEGKTDAVFVFQAGSSLTTATSSRVLLIGGAQACNVFWQLGASATLGTGSTFRGTVMALTSITVTTGTTVEGRVLARNGAVTLDTDVVTRPGCAAAVTPSASPSTTPSVAPPASPAPTTAGTPVPSRTPGGTTTGQVTRVPRGGVGTGDGSAASSAGGWTASDAASASALGALVLALAAGPAAVRRRRSRS
jgi:hypothetical protein